MGSVTLFLPSLFCFFLACLFVCFLSFPIYCCMVSITGRYLYLSLCFFSYPQIEVRSTGSDFFMEDILTNNFLFLLQMSHLLRIQDFQVEGIFSLNLSILLHCILCSSVARKFHESLVNFLFWYLVLSEWKHIHGIYLRCFAWLKLRLE
jgi:hypothetical protein